MSVSLSPPAWHKSAHRLERLSSASPAKSMRLLLKTVLHLPHGMSRPSATRCDVLALPPDTSWHGQGGSPQAQSRLRWYHCHGPDACAHCLITCDTPPPPRPGSFCTTRAASHHCPPVPTPQVINSPSCCDFSDGLPKSPCPTIHVLGKHHHHYQTALGSPLDLVNPDRKYLLCLTPHQGYEAIIVVAVWVSRSR